MKDKALIKQQAMLNALIELLSAKGMLDGDDYLRLMNRAKDNFEALNIKYGDGI